MLWWNALSEEMIAANDFPGKLFILMNQVILCWFLMCNVYVL